MEIGAVLMGLVQVGQHRGVTRMPDVEDAQVLGGSNFEAKGDTFAAHQMKPLIKPGVV